MYIIKSSENLTTKYNNFILFLIAVLFFFTPDDAVTFRTNGNQIFIFFKYVVYFYVILYLFYNAGLKKSINFYNPKAILVFDLFIFSFLITLLVNHDFITTSKIFTGKN